MSNPARASRFGCFGVFCLIFLLLFTTVGLGTLWWLDPDWFDRMAFWRPKPFDRDVIFSDGGAPETAETRPVFTPQSTLTSDGLRLMQERAVEVDYDPASGATLTSHEGAVFSFPPGSIPEATRIRAVPIASIPMQSDGENIAVAGPCYKVFIGDRGHYRFLQPMRVTLPFDARPPEDDGVMPQLAIYTREDDRWVAFPSTVDEAGRTVTAEVSHCSPIVPAAVYVIKLGVATAAAVWAWSNSGWSTVANSREAVLQRVRSNLSDKYETANFTIFYTKTGTDAVPGDPGFPLKPASPQAGHPNFVVLIGEHLEYCRSNFGVVGMPILAGKTIVSLVNIGKVFGATPPGGGPVTITTQWEQSGLDAKIRGTVAHELIHVAQHQLFGGEMLPGRWWMEVTAAYLADVFWDRQKNPTNMIKMVFTSSDEFGEAKLLTQPINNPDAESNYEYGLFLKWLERKGNAYKVVNQVNVGGKPTLDAFDEALKAEFKQSLSDLFEEFAKDYYHNDLWRGEIISASVFSGSAQKQAKKQSSGPERFALLTRLLNNTKADIHASEQTSIPKLPPLTSFAFIVHVERLTEYQKAKLVFDIGAMAGQGRLDDDVSVWVAAGAVGPRLPTSGANGGFTRAAHQYGPDSSGKPAIMHVVENVLAPEGNDHVTVVVTNRSLSRTAAGLTVRRWALMRPQWVTAQRVASALEQWSVEWDPTWLYQDKMSGVLKAWKFYRRKPGDKDFPADPIVEKPYDPQSTETPPLHTQIGVPDKEDSVFTAAAVDIYGNEGYQAIVESEDPFQGIWKGTVTLVDGSFSGPIFEQINKDIEEKDKKKQQEINNEQDPKARARLQKEWEEHKQYRARMKEILEWVLTTGEQLLRIGVPVELQIRRTDNKYYFGISKVLLQGTDMKPDVPLKRLGRHSLGFEEPLPVGDPTLYIRLHRPNEIRDEYSFDGTIGNKKVRYKIKWSFRREQPDSTP